VPAAANIRLRETQVGGVSDETLGEGDLSSPGVELPGAVGSVAGLRRPFSQASATRGSALGQNMLAVRANERAAAAVGINVRPTKLVGFALSAATRCRTGSACPVSGSRWERQCWSSSC